MWLCSGPRHGRAHCDPCAAVFRHRARPALRRHRLAELSAPRAVGPAGGRWAKLHRGPGALGWLDRHASRREEELHAVALAARPPRQVTARSCRRGKSRHRNDNSYTVFFVTLFDINTNLSMERTRSESDPGSGKRTDSAGMIKPRTSSHKSDGKGESYVGRGDAHGVH